MSYPYKICDPVHGFIRFSEIIQRVIDSGPFQRLRYIRQMGVAYLVYPGATHSRFEHSLGVMELATRIYDALSHEGIAQEKIDYWRLILRLAALCHDLGHLPFSHTAEKALLPHGGHEQMTLKLIQSDELNAIWQGIGPTVQNDIIKLAVNENIVTLSPWERALSQIITEDNFGADRMDYLLRDSYYTGVGFGHFDYHQLIDTLRIVPKGEEFTLGVIHSGIQSVESLWIARYMMYARVYQHPKSCVYSNHMNRFMCRYYARGVPTKIEDYLEQTDCTILSALLEQAKQGDYDAKSLLKREKTHQKIPLDRAPDKRVLDPLKKQFGEWIFIDDIPQKIMSREFPVLLEDGRVVSSYEVSAFLKEIPCEGKPICIYAHPRYAQRIKTWLHEQAYLGSPG